MIVTAQCWLRQGQGPRSFRADYALCNPEGSQGFEQTQDFVGEAPAVYTRS